MVDSYTWITDSYILMVASYPSHTQFTKSHPSVADPWQSE